MVVWLEPTEAHNALGRYLVHYLWMEARLDNALTIYVGHEDCGGTAASLIADASMPSKLRVLRRLIADEGWGDDLGDVPKLVEKASVDRNLVSHSPQTVGSTGESLSVVSFRGGDVSLRDLDVGEMMARLLAAKDGVTEVFKRIFERRGHGLLNLLDM